MQTLDWSVETLGHVTIRLGFVIIYLNQSSERNMFIDVAWKTQSAAPVYLMLLNVDAKQPNASKDGKDDEDEVAESDSSHIVTFDDDLELESSCV